MSSLQGTTINSTNQTPPALTEFYLSGNGTVANYLAMMGSDGNTYLIDLSDPTKLGIVDSNGNSLYIDSADLHFATPDCSLVINVDIANFAQQLSTQAKSTPLQSRDTLSKRFSETSFFVVLQLTDQCQQPVTDLTPSLGVGPTPCQSVPGSNNRQSTWSCQFPGANSGEMQCENSVNDWIIALTGGLIGSATNWSTVGNLILQGLEKLIGREALLAIVLAAGITAGPEVLAALAAFGTIAGYGVAALAVLETAIAVYNSLSSNGISQDVCMQLHASEFPLPLMLQAGSTTTVIASLASAPTSAIQQAQTINDPNDTACSTCSNPGQCGTFNVIYDSSCGPLGDCTCGYDADGQGVCLQNQYCSAGTCAQDSDCGVGGICWTNNCCGFNICTSPASVCASTTRIMFRSMRPATRGVCTGSYCK
jgi:hypothetical protein